jgi:hypothetical protein
MPEPLIFAAAAFSSVIVVGTLMVAVNDWLEARHVASGSPSCGRMLRELGRRGGLRERSYQRRSRAAAHTLREPGRKQGTLVADWR